MSRAPRTIAFTLAFLGLASSVCMADNASALRARAQRFFHVPARLGPIAMRTPFAVINYDSVIENQHFRGQLLYRKYSFGWQLLDIAIGRFRECDLRAFGVLSPSVNGLLANAQGLALQRETCPGISVPSIRGVSRDEEAIRKLLQARYSGEAIHSLSIIDGYALAGWFGWGGGEALLARRFGTWRQIADGGGAMSACNLVQKGVPPTIARRLILRQYAPREVNAAVRRFADVDECYRRRTLRSSSSSSGARVPLVRTAGGGVKPPENEPPLRRAGA